MGRLGILEPGTTFAKRYRIGERMVGGSTAEAYAAERLVDGARVVLRFIHPPLTGFRPFVVEAFVQVARAKEAPSEHVVAIDDFGESRGGAAWISTAFTDAPRLRELLDGPALPWPRVAGIVGAIARAYAGALAAGTPALRMAPHQLYGDDRAMVIDIVGVILGSPRMPAPPHEVGGTHVAMPRKHQEHRLAMLAPEQLQGKPIDARMWVYTLGVIACRLATGAMPFPDADTPSAVISAQLKRTPDVPLDGPGRDVLLRALAKAPADRYDDAAAFAAALATAR